MGWVAVQRRRGIAWQTRVCAVQSDTRRYNGHDIFFLLRQHSPVTGKINQGSPYRHVPKCARGVSERHTWCGVLVIILIIVKSLREVSWLRWCLCFPLPTRRVIGRHLGVVLTL